MEEPGENKLLFAGGGDDFHNFEVFQSFGGGCLTYIVAALVVLLVMVVILR